MRQSFSDIVRSAPLLLTEGAIVERLRREFRLPLDPEIVHAAFIYNDNYRAVLWRIYAEYIGALKPAGVPFLIFTSTWRANRERLAAAGLDVRTVNADNVRFLRTLRSGHPDDEDRIYIGGLLGCRGDAYKPEEALSEDEAVAFHRTQAGALMEGGADFLFASTLPALTEAVGIARVFASLTSAYMLSFVIRPDGRLLDGTTLHDALTTIDARVTPAPLAYMVNCVHPRVFLSAMNHPAHSSPFVRSRMLGLQANTSEKSPEELDGLGELDTAEAVQFAEDMDALRASCGTRLLGGCCGTDHRHISALAERVSL